MKIALITGITGQDGSYLAEFLLEKNYLVYGIIRLSSSSNIHRIDHLSDNENLVLKYGDLSDINCLLKILEDIKHNHKFDILEIYNLAAMSHVKVSFDIPEYTGNIDALGTLRLLEAIRAIGLTNQAKIYQASTSELYGKVHEIPQSETTPFYPRSPYGVAKLYSFWICKNYREAYNMFICNGILFNHESYRRGSTFITRKITIALGKIYRGEQDKLVVGNIDAQRDWGHANDYIKGMWLMLQQNKADDYVLATGKTYSVRFFIEQAFSLRGYNIKWKGTGVNEIGYDINTGKELIFVSEKYFRPTEVDILMGNPEKAFKKLGWKPEYDIYKLIKEMVDNDCPK